ncbi:predicted protein [Plenodomus lingam JN3]|uniref:Predicted protein n=1 Tax=Leptosphaeria maculans (strain JN3 / isolate v23.1.3 / race Av1-4-5-6-7-8) TaxID=985895 RepID=E5AE23_LEPMJ|nr:predicted protein [Plenodomus lingam JN3]CBY01462.1 predicted protein [Plenodomus lingam JN3]
MSYNSVHVAYFATVPYLQKVTPSLDIRVNLSGLTATQYSGSPPCQLAVSLHSDSYYFRCKIHIERQILVSSVRFEATSYRTTGVVGLRLMLNDGVPWLLWATVQGLSSAYMRRLR